MRKNLNRIYKLSSLVLILTLISFGCSTTTKNSATTNNADNLVEEDTTTMEDKMPSNSAYQADNTDVDVENLPTPPQSNQATLKPFAPEQYTVQKGDTLWDLSNKFLNQPWYWPEIWYMNPQVQNPHLIYPGDVIKVIYVGGKPYITVNGDNRIAGIERLSPIMRGEPIEVVQQVIPIQAIEQFLTRPLIVGLNELDSSPHIVASRDGRLIYGANDLVYVRDAADLILDTSYNVYRPGKAFKDPMTGGLLGYEAIHVGDGKLVKESEPASLFLTSANREVLRGDRILEVESIDTNSAFYPRIPEQDVNGYVIYLYDAISQVGAYQIVAVNLGKTHGIEKGHLLAISRTDELVTDPHARKGQEELVSLPNDHTANAIAFRVFNDLSYLFVLDANRPVRNADIVTTR